MRVILKKEPMQHERKLSAIQDGRQLHAPNEREGFEATTRGASHAPDKLLESSNTVHKPASKEWGANFTTDFDVIKHQRSPRHCTSYSKGYSFRGERGRTIRLRKAWSFQRTLPLTVHDINTG